MLSSCVTISFSTHRGGPGSRTGSMWGLWWTKRHWGRISPITSVSPANHSTDLSIIIITRGWHNRRLSSRSVEWTLIPSPTMQIKKLWINQLLKKVDCKWFWRWCITLRITGYLDFVYRPVFYKLENITFRKLDLFPSSDEGEDTYSVGPLRKS
jgi:hypothetical protein